MPAEVMPEEFASIVREVIQRLARDPQAAHLWHWHPRPDCADTPPGPTRRSQLSALLALLGTAAAPGVFAACHRRDSTPAPPCGDDPCAQVPDATRNQDGRVCGDDPCACGDDPCAQVPDAARNQDGRV